MLNHGMQIERQIAIVCVMVGGTLAYPEVRELMAHSDATPGGSLMAGGIFGAFSAFFGTLIAVDYDPAWFKALAVGFWGLVSLAFAAAMQYGALRSPGPVRMGFFEFFTVLVLAAFFGTLYGVWRAARRR